jgi:hypothetical protein
MRRALVATVLIGLFAGLVATVGLRSRTPHVAPFAPASSASASAAPSASAPIASASAPASASAVGSAATAPVDAGPARLFDRPLRVTGLGWDVLVPGVLENKGLAPGAGEAFGAAGITVELAVADRMSAVEAALARGGADKDGADVALVPLPSFVASYERLRALAPEVFFVVGWSRGREALRGGKDVLTAPPSGEVKLGGAAGEPATFLGLFALDEAGVRADKVKLLAPPWKPGEAQLEATPRDAAPDAAGGPKPLLTTADASRLVPTVAVAQRGLLDKHGPALAAWAGQWLDGQAELESDPPAAARAVAAAQGAPDPLALLRQLGESAPASLADNARVAGLSGRGAVTLDMLFQQAWRLWRAAGVLATPAPETSPVSTSVIRALVRARAAALPPGDAASPKPRSGDAAARVLLTHRDAGAKLDEPAFLADIGLLAGVFERSRLRVTVRGPGGVDAARTKKLLESAQGQFDLAPGRLVVGDKVPDKAIGAIDVLDVP